MGEVTDYTRENVIEILRSSKFPCWGIAYGKIMRHDIKQGYYLDTFKEIFDEIGLETKIYHFLCSSNDILNAVRSISPENTSKIPEVYLDAAKKKCGESFPQIIKLNFRPFFTVLNSAALRAYIQEKDLIFL